MRFSRSVPWLVTVGLHGLLIALALAWVIASAVIDKKVTDPETFVVSGGGGQAAPPRTNVRPERRVTPPTHARLTVRTSAATTVALSALPDFPTTTLSGLAAGPSGTGRSQGLGATSAGLGMGPGVAAGRVGLPVLGLRVQAQRLAVYLDSSGSMRPHLARIEAEIRAAFPAADVFRFDGARIVVMAGQIAEGRGYDGPALERRPGMSDPATLTSQGKRLLAQLTPHCEAGSLGAWLDWMLEERYDALVVFSDFQDGIRQYRLPSRGAPELIYADSKRRQLDEREPGDDRWRRRWLERFATATSGRAPRLYLLTSEVEPQEFLQQCAVASGGGLTMVEVGRPRPAR